jgi:hypothetical protein
VTLGLRVIIADPVNDAHNVHAYRELLFLADLGGGNKDRLHPDVIPEAAG